MTLLGFAPLAALVVAASAGGLLGLAQSDAVAPWAGDRSELPAHAPTRPDAATVLGCTTAIEGTIREYGLLDALPPEDPGDPYEQAREIAADQLGERSATDADLTYSWTDASQTTGDVLVGDPRPSWNRPVALVSFELNDGHWYASGWYRCASGDLRQSDR